MNKNINIFPNIDLDILDEEGYKKEKYSLELEKIENKFYRDREIPHRYKEFISALPSLSKKRERKGFIRKNRAISTNRLSISIKKKLDSAKREESYGSLPF